jgi:hypothetical protein
MTTYELFKNLILSNTICELESNLNIYISLNAEFMSWIPFGGRDNNRGTIEASADPGRSLVERLTNGIDAILEEEFSLHKGFPDCRSPKEAATAWLNVPMNGLSEMSTTERRTLARRVEIKLKNGEGKSSRVVEIRDFGIGIKPEDMKKTILSLNESNKIQKYYVAGAYGQGGSSTLATSKYVFLASRKSDSDVVSFTVAKYEDLPAEQYKTGRYVYLVENGEVLNAIIPLEEFNQGTLVKHLGYDLSSYSSPLGPNSVYGLLNQTLFDPVLPVWLDNEIHSYRRVIKGSRNSLNGAVDEGDESSRGPSLAHNIKMFYTTLAEFGRIGIEYWVLDKPTTNNKRPTAAFVNPVKPVILSINGQNHGELPQNIIRKDAELPYLSQRLICHIDCNHLTPNAKRSLLVSNREGVRKGMVNDLITTEIIKVLKTDDELTRLNNEAREQGVKERDQDAVKQMRSEVARILKMQGLNVGIDFGTQSSSVGSINGKPGGHRKPYRKPLPLDLHEPPTYIKILWPEDEKIEFFAEQRRYIRIETDANSNYFNVADESKSKINIICNSIDLVFSGATPLENGRMRIIIQAKADSNLGGGGYIRIELTRTGLPTLSDQREITIVNVPPAKPSKTVISLPPFDIIPVENPEDQKWIALAWPEDINKIASSAEMENGKLNIYYSKVFPKYYEQYKNFERKDTLIAESFTSRYEVWLTVHSLLLFHDEQQGLKETNPESSLDSSETNELYEQKERCRLATIAAMIAGREVNSPAILQDE